MSFSLDSCTPEPLCDSRVMNMNNVERIVKIDDYLGDPSTADWVSQGNPLKYGSEGVLLTMGPNTPGTVLASTVYMWYGSVKATFKTSRGAGVVTAFILLSDVRDEIDYEFVGVDLGTAQTNYYFQGILDCTFPIPVTSSPHVSKVNANSLDQNSGNISLTDTYNNYHTYEIQWTPDSITWLIDGKVGRVQKKSDTWNATANQWNFPQSPARVELSIWPGGASTNAPGTIAWAGGPIDWHSGDIAMYGYDFAVLKEVEIQCYAPPLGANPNNAVSYTYSSWLGTNDTIVIGTKKTALKSFQGTGLNMDAGDDSSTASGGSASSIPGGTASGPGNAPASPGSPSGSSPSCPSGQFTQNCGSSSKSDGGRVAGSERILGTSAFAVVIALAGMMVL